MESLQKIHSTGSMTTYRVQEVAKIADLLKKLNLESKYFVILVDGKKASPDATIQKDSEITILPKIAGGGRGRRNVKTKDKIQKPPRNKNKGPMWTVEGGTVTRNRKSCPKCGPGVFMAEHYDRMHCGRCGYTKFKRTERKSISDKK